MFLTHLEEELNTTYNNKGALTNQSTLNNCLDLFALIANLRDKVLSNNSNELKEYNRKFLLALKEDPLITIKILFWCRDIRGGQGERSVFKYFLNILSNQKVDNIERVISLIPVYGRYDDILCLLDTPLEKAALNFLKRQFEQDLNNLKEDKSISLLGKWLPSANSGKKSRKLALKLIKHFGLNERSYRKRLSSLRKKLNIVENKMCKNQWDIIDYEQVPSKAMFMYKHCFMEHSFKRFSKYLEEVKANTKEIKSSTLYPYDIVKDILNGIDNKVLDLQWDNLPNYMDKPFNGLVVADTSGSMYPNAITVSISLAIYIAERNLHPLWKDKFITFSGDPSLQTIIGKDISEKVYNLKNSDWGYNTNIFKVFQLILNTAIKNKLKQEELPEKLIIISDMQFDQCDNNLKSNYEAAKDLFKQQGYELPQIIFWNVKAHNNFPITKKDINTCIISGKSPSNLKVLLNDISSPLDILFDTINCERYDLIERLLTA